jgi:hypothetical protein
MNDIIKRGFFRVLVDMKWTSVRNPHYIHEDICQILEPYNLTVWDNDVFPISMGVLYETHSHGYYDIHVGENELYGDQPVKDLMDKITGVEGVKGIVFIDTSSVYCIPLFYTNSQTPLQVFKAIKSSFIEETLSSYEHEKNRNNA